MKCKSQAQYSLDRKATKISALSSGKLKKYEYFTGEGLGYKPGVVGKINLSIIHLVEFSRSFGKKGVLKGLKHA